MNRPNAMITMMTLACALGAPTAATAGQPNFCKMTTQNMLAACQAGATDDQNVALARCQNRADAIARKMCRQAAAADTKDARQSCVDQRDARQEVCGNLGPAAYNPIIDPAAFVAAVDNPYFPLVPGTTLIYESHTAAGLERDEFAITHNTKVILGVTCVEVHDVAFLDGDLIEDTLDWFAQDTAGNVWYFGENSKQLENGLVVGVEGSWTGGVDDAKPGIVMKAAPAVGDVYRQEFSLDTAEDIGEVLSLNQSASVPYGNFTNCLETADTTPLEPDGLEQKFYAPGVGTVRTLDVETGETEDLIQITGP